MNLEKYNEIFGIVAEALLDIKEIDHEKIDFIITKGKGSKLKIIVGFENEEEEHFVYIFNNQKTVNYYDIQIKRKYDSVLEPSIELFILTKLNDGYEVKYMKTDTHCWLWNYITKAMNDISIIEKGVEKYLYFCKETGVNSTALTFYWGRKIKDVYCLFIDNRFNGFDIILSEDIGEKRLILGIQYEIFVDKKRREKIENILYRVTVYYKDTQKIEYNDFHEDISHAFADYRNHFFGLNCSYYLEKEQEDTHIIEELKKLVSAPLL